MGEVQYWATQIKVTSMYRHAGHRVQYVQGVGKVLVHYVIHLCLQEYTYDSRTRKLFVSSNSDNELRKYAHISFAILHFGKATKIHRPIFNLRCRDTRRDEQSTCVGKMKPVLWEM